MDTLSKDAARYWFIQGFKHSREGFNNEWPFACDSPRTRKEIDVEGSKNLLMKHFEAAWERAPLDSEELGTNNSGKLREY